VDIFILHENGFFGGVEVELIHNMPDLLSEVTFDHDLHRHDGYIQVEANKDRLPEEHTHREVYITRTEAAMNADTARETQAQYDDIGDVY